MIKGFWKYLSGNLLEVCVSIILSTLTILSSVALMGVSSYLIILAGFHPSIAVLQVSIVGVRFFGISRSVFRYLERLTTHKVNLKVLGNIRISIFQKISKNFIQASDLFSGSEMTNILINDINQMENLFVRLLSPFVVSAMTSIFVGIYLGFTSYPIVSVYLVGYLMSGLLLPIVSIKIGKAIHKKNKSARRDYQTSVINFNQFIDEAIFYRVETKLIGQISETEKRLEKSQSILGIWQSVWNAVSFLMSQSVFISILLLSVYLANNGKIDIIQIGVISLVVLSSFEVVSNLPSAAFLYGELEESNNRIFDLEKTKSNEEGPGEEKPASLFPVQIQELNFSFPNNKEKLRLKNINIEINRGEKIAILGENGAGKSTLLDILQGYRTNYRGEIYYDGVNLRDIDKNFLRSKISFVTANQYLFNTTIKQNLLITGVEADEKQLIDVLKSVDLFQPPKIALETIIDEFGANLSSGEIRRLSIAQLLLRNNEILILDEPFINLDPKSISDIFQLITEKFSQKTIIMVTHQLFFLDFFDKIYILDEGSIIQTGNKEELLSQDGKFQEFLNII